jgi:acetyltransferase-like isoleucine patch superfamily enzyme
MTVFEILVHLYRRFHNLMFFGYGRLYSLIFFDRYVKLMGKASAKIHPATHFVMYNSKIIVEDGTAKIGYLTGWGLKENCHIRMANSTLNIIGNVSLRPGFSIWAVGATIVIRNGTVINQQTGIVACHRVEIGEHCRIAMNVTIMDNDMHKHATGAAKPVMECKAVIIKDHVWIGRNAMILKGVTIGEGAIVAPGSIVTKDVKERTLVAGVPARVIQENVVWEA